MASVEAVTEIVMPRLSDSMEEGVVLRWLKQVGEEVRGGEELVEIETDKANMVYESDAAGTLLEILAREGEGRPVGDPIARIGAGGGAHEPPRSASASGTDGGSAGTGRPAAKPRAEQANGRVKASPLARRIAREHGLELEQIAGSGRDGRIIKADVEAALASGSASTADGTPAPGRPARRPSSTPSPAQAGSSPQPGNAPTAPDTASSGAVPGVEERPETAKGETELVAPSKLQRTVARRMAESKATAPHFYLETEIEMSRCIAARARIKEGAREGELVPSFNDMVVKACAIALREHPRANGSYRDGSFELHSRVNVGIAVAGQDALVVPTIFDANRKGLRQIAAESRALAQRVREGTVTPPELSGGTFTVSNLGMRGITSFAAVINPPQAGILAVGAIEAKPVVRSGEITAGQMMAVNLACDHRILYGADGADFLGRVKALLEEPAALAL